jgi:pyruvate dehydrogenase E1 component alpha subunit
MEIPSLTFPLLCFLDENGKLLAPSSLESSLLIKGYQTMLLTRLVEERMVTLQRQGLITFAMSSLGEEACAVGSAAALEMSDWMYPQYREAGILFFRGFTIQEFVHQMFGNAKDPILGRQMPNHFGARRLNIVTVSSPIATKIPHAAGAAYAMKMRGEKSVVICYFGDGATSEGDFHVGLNFAAVRKAPVIFFCRNNGYAISTPCSRQFSCQDIAAKGVGYGIPALRVDGNDFIGVYEAVAKARQFCLEGRGPILIEAITYRLGAHSTSDDPSLYRNEEEAEKWKKKGPLVRLRNYLEAQQLWNENKESEWNQLVSEEITKAIQSAKETAKPALESLIEHVYFEPTPQLKVEFEELKRTMQWPS